MLTEKTGNSRPVADREFRRGVRLECNGTIRHKEELLWDIVEGSNQHDITGLH
jgi:hypothetical protein